MHELASTSFSSTAAKRAGPSRRAFAALVIANICLAFGPWFVRLADVGPIASAFWRLTLAVPFLLVAMRMLGERTPRMGPMLWGMMALSGLLFAGDLASWHFGILKTKLANATLFGNAPSLMFPIYGFLVARAWPNRSQVMALLLAAIVSQVLGQGLMTYALGHFSPLVIGLALLVQPVVTATIGWLVYDERLGALDLVGAVAVATALVLVRRPEKRAA